MKLIKISSLFILLLEFLCPSSTMKNENNAYSAQNDEYYYEYEYDNYDIYNDNNNYEYQYEYMNDGTYQDNKIIIDHNKPGDCKWVE